MKNWEIPYILVLAGFACLLLAGCSSAPPVVVTKVVYQAPEIPAELLSLGPMPAVPARPRTPAMRLNYVADLWQDDKICHADMSGVVTAIDADKQIAGEKPAQASTQGK